MIKVKQLLCLKLVLIALSLFFMTSCGSFKSSTSKTVAEKTKNSSSLNNDGLSIDNAVVIKAKNSFEGIPKEYEFIDRKHGKRGVGWKFKTQSLNRKDGKSFDVISIIDTKTNKQLKYYFDITDFYGKF
ncbi:hypothetical protein WNY78_03625 [Psychroserpens sp. AS72]|uniref:hypothetical protein n=1 Tax=Psychroserpens sp. AS72 TaxID=3135775 RepID=UPI00317AA7F4